MPRKQDLSQAVIYHIRRMETKEVVYVGSSCNFKQRQSGHRFRCYDEKCYKYNYPIYVYIREQGGFDLFEVVPVAFHKLENDIQLRIEEQKEIDKYPNAFNKLRAHTSIELRRENRRGYNKVFREKHPEKCKESDRIKYEKNKEVIIKRVRKYYEENKEHHAQKGKEYYEANKEHLAQKAKEYQEKHKEEIAQKDKERREANKQELAIKRRQKVECPCCKKVLTKMNLPRHQRDSCPSNP